MDANNSDSRQVCDEIEQTLAAIAEVYADFESGRYRPLTVADAEFRRLHNIPAATIENPGNSSVSEN